MHASDGTDIAGTVSFGGFSFFRITYASFDFDNRKPAPKPGMRP